jgi:organic radical activating enzyme
MNIEEQHPLWIVDCHDDRILQQDPNCKVFCKHPFDHIYSDSFGVYMPCYRANVDHPDGIVPAVDIKSDFPAPKADEMLPSDWHNSEHMQQLREDMLSGEVTPLISKVCAQCIEQEKTGAISPRRAVYEPPSTDGRYLILKLRLFGNTCNLSCYMCRIHESSSRIKQTQQLMLNDPEFGRMLEYDNLPESLKNGSHLDFNNKDPEFFNKIIQDIVELAPKIKKLKIIGGEPFMLTSHYKLLDALIEADQSSKIRLEYVSNLTKTKWAGNNVEDYIPHFKSVRISWSMDGIGERGNYIRNGSDWESNVENYRYLKDKADIEVSVCASALSVLYMNETMEWIESEGLRYNMNNVFLPEVCRIDSLHPKIRKRLAPNAHPFVKPFLEEEVEDWEERWENLLKYLRALDTLNGTNYKKVFPILADDTL